MSAYYFSKVLLETPVRAIPSIVLGSILYFLAGLNPHPVRFFVFLGIMALTSAAALSLSLAVSAMAPTLQGAQALAPIVTVVFILFGGFYINTESIPAGAKWMEQINYLRYSFAAFSVNDLAG